MGYVFFLGVSTLFIEQPKPQCEYTLKDWNQDAGKLYFDIGRASQKRHDFKAAIKAYTTALENNPYYLECYDCLGICFELCKQLDKALQTYLKAMSINPNFIETRLQKVKALPPVDAPTTATSATKPPWHGESLANKTIYVHADGSLSDTIFFLRFLPKLLKPGTKIIFKAQDDLYALLKNTLPSEITMLQQDQQPDENLYDYYTSLHHIPSILKVSYTTIPARDGYLHANQTKVAAFKQEFFTTNAFKVGIVWQGNPEQSNDKNRSIPLTYFIPLTTINNVQLYSLQIGQGKEQLAQLPTTNTIINLEPKLKNFDDIAAAVENLDLLVCVDTSIAHLSGALGKPTWVLLPRITDWRWLSYSEGNQSCWYSQVKKFRQKKTGNWHEVFERVTEQLQEIISTRYGGW